MYENIPLFPEAAPLELAHKPVLDGLLAALQPRISEFTFTNLYIWRHAYGLHVTQFEDGVVCLLSWHADPEDSFLLAPLGRGAGAEHVRQALALLERRGHDPKLCRIDRTLLDRLGIREDDEWAVASSREEWDYVYRIADLIELPAEKYPDKVRHVRDFSRKFEFEYRRITPELVPGCKELQELWCDEKHCDLYSSLRAEARAVNEILERLDDLHIVGGAILVNDRVQAFALGEPLNDETIVIHIEKASPELHGAFQVINQEFLRQEWSDWPYVHREQDVGAPGLRKSKESYLPVRMVEKFTVWRRA